MGTAELDILHKQLTIHSWIITYGTHTTPELTEQIREEIETMWNDVKGIVYLKREQYDVRFRIEAYMRKDLRPEDIYGNYNPKNNYFRIEEYARGNISFVDDLGSNTGYWMLENLYKGSTTAAHEYGHTLGLAHPDDMDLRGQGRPGIMYARGTLVDSEFQYDPSKPAGVTGGTMHPMHRIVKQKDIDLLNLHKLSFTNGIAVAGEFTNIWHDIQQKL
jgi:Peptidase M66